MSHRPSLRRLEYFVAVAVELHFGRAAQHLGIAQPALSQQIALLEREVRAPLFRRTRRQVELTQAGTTLLPAARRILTQLDRVSDDIARIGTSENVVVRVGYVVPGAFRSLHDAVKHVHRTMPHVRILLREGASPRHLESVASGALDVALVRGPAAHPELRVETLDSEHLVAVLPANSASRSRRFNPAAWRDTPVVAFRHESAPGLFDLIEKASRDLGLAFNDRIESDDWATMVTLVAAGAGIALLPQSVASFQRTGVVYRSLAQ